MSELSTLALVLIQDETKDGGHEWRVLDTDLALRIGTPSYLKQPRNIRQVIKAHWQELEKFGEICERISKMRRLITNQYGAQSEQFTKVTEYLLNQNQAMYLVAKSDSPQANALTVAILQAFEQARNEVKRLRESQYSRFELTLLESKSKWERLWDDQLRNEFRRLYKYDDDHSAWPLASLQMIGKIYDLVLGVETMAEVRSRSKRDGGNDVVKLHQYLKPESRRLFEEELARIAGFAGASKTPKQLLGFLEAHYSRVPTLGICQSGRMRQLELGAGEHKYCEHAKCGLMMAAGSKFCPHCGRRQRRA